MSGLFRQPKAPKAPDPTQTAATQFDTNVRSASEQARLGMSGQVTPEGTLSWVADPSAPSGYRAETAYTGNRAALEGVTGQQINRVGAALAQPLDLSNPAVEGRIMELGRRRLDPMFAERGAALETDLINRGIRPGGNAYESMHRVFDEGKNDAYNQLLLTGRDRAVSEALLERDQPMKELQALSGIGTASAPQFVQAPQPGVAPVDYGGMVARNYDAATQQYGQKLQSQAAMLGGLAGAAGTALGGWAMGAYQPRVPARA
jgi:hypothetical protein